MQRYKIVKIEPYHSCFEELYEIIASNYVDACTQVCLHYLKHLDSADAEHERELFSISVTDSSGQNHVWETQLDLSVQSWEVI